MSDKTAEEWKAEAPRNRRELFLYHSLGPILGAGMFGAAIAASVADRFTFYGAGVGLMLGCLLRCLDWRKCRR